MITTAAARQVKQGPTARVRSTALSGAGHGFFTTVSSCQQPPQCGAQCVRQHDQQQEHDQDGARDCRPRTAATTEIGQHGERPEHDECHHQGEGPLPGNVGLLGRDREGYFQMGDAAGLAALIQRFEAVAAGLDPVRRGLRRAPNRVVLFLDELQPLEQGLQVRACKGCIGDVDDLHAAIRVDHEDSRFGELPVRLLR